MTEPSSLPVQQALGLLYDQMSIELLFATRCVLQGQEFLLQALISTGEVSDMVIRLLDEVQQQLAVLQLNTRKRGLHLPDYALHRPTVH